MNADVERALGEKVLSSKAGREVDPGVVRSAVRWALARHGAKEAEKAAKTRLHQLYGSYVGEGWLKAARRVLDDLESGKADSRAAALKLMALHGSTWERLAHIEECYGKIFESCGLPVSVLDVACGLNPISFLLAGLPDVRLLAIDAGSDAVAVLNRFFTASGMANARAESGDVMAGLPAGPFDLALVMKFLPLAERIETGGAIRLLDAIDARHIVVSFPTRSLSGRNVGMERNYSEWFEELGFNGEITERFVCGEEVFYVILKDGDCC